ncbi:MULTISPECIES: hypothetical protein [Exiguobacterium]|nr:MULTISPECIES: hypothetical protein [Exiguobacterium]
MIQLIARIEAHPNQGEQLVSIIEGVIPFACRSRVPDVSDTSHYR